MVWLVVFDNNNPVVVWLVIADNNIQEWYGW